MKVLSFLIIITTSCLFKTREGNIINESGLKSIYINLTKKEDVNTLLGGPSIVENDIWYYIESEKTWHAFFDKKTIKHRVVAITFDDNATVKQITEYSEKDIVPVKAPKIHLNVERPDIKKLLRGE